MDKNIPIFQDANNCKTPNRTPLIEISNQINNWCIPKMYSGHEEFMGVVKSPIVELTPDRARCSLLSSTSPGMDDALMAMDQSDEVPITPNTSAFIQSIRPKLEDNVDMWMDQMLPSPKSEGILELDCTMDQGQEDAKEAARLPTSWPQNRDHRRVNLARKLTFEHGTKEDPGEQCDYAEKEEIVQTTSDPDRGLVQLIDDEVPAIGLTEEVKTQFEVVEIMVMHSKKSKRLVLGTEEGFPGASSSKGKVLLSPNNVDIPLNGTLSDAPQPFRVIKCGDKNNPTLHFCGQELLPGQVCLSGERPAEEFDSICHFMRYEMVDGRKTKVYECGICRRTFKHQYTLMRHLPTHTDERNFACDTCGKAFRQMSTLIQHGAIHSNVRPYVCDVCQNTFNRVSTLISHKKTHSGNKPHQCTYCGKRFHQKGNLRNHIFTHTNERPYKCEVCGKGFNQKSNLICHRSRYHAAQEDFSCELCAVKFPKKRGLVSHMFYKHNVEAEPNPRRRKPSDKLPRSRELRKMSAAGVPNAVLKKAFYPMSFKELSPAQEVGGGDNNCKAPPPPPPPLLRLPEMDSMQHLVIDPINSEAMSKAKSLGQIPFVLFKTARGTEQLMRVMSAPQFNKQLLVPVTVEDLKSTQNGLGKIVAPNTTHEFQVSTVATMQQKVHDSGKVEMVEIPYPSTCQIKIEPVFQNLALTQITGWPGPAVTTAFVNPDASGGGMEAFGGLTQWRGAVDGSCFQGQSLYPVSVSTADGASFHVLEQAGLMSPQLLELDSPNINYEDYKPYMDNNSNTQLSTAEEIIADDVDFSALLS